MKLLRARVSDHGQTRIGSGIGRLVEWGLLSRLRSLGQSKSSFDAFRFFHLVVCSNQGWLTQYLFLVSRKHRDLKESMASTSATPSIKREAAIELSHYSRSEFFAAAEKNFGFLRSYFAETRGVSPRLCIKGNFLKDGRSHVISIFRDSQVAYDSGYDVHENSGFDHCLRTGQYFLDNDLPASSMKGRYRNPRIDQEVVREIAASVLMSKHETVSSNWSSAWKSGENDSASAYRSTLIVPITLLNNDLSAEFREKYNADDADRLVFGFLCMDSPSEGFFEKPDVDVGYVIADFLALFSYAMFNYTDYSNTFNRAKETMDEIPEELMMASSRNFNIGDFDSVVEPTRRKKSDKNAMVYFTSPAAIDSEVE